MAYEKMDVTAIAELAEQFDKENKPKTNRFVSFLHSLFSALDYSDDSNDNYSVYKNAESDPVKALFAMSGKPYHPGITGISELYDD